MSQFEDVLRRFLSDCEHDANLQNFARKHTISVHYSITDSKLDFHMLFGDGVVRAGLGAPPGETDFTLKMDADTFDGMMSGRLRGMTVAMSGKLKFKGDTMKGMALQQIGKDLSRLYTQARDQVGNQP